ACSQRLDRAPVVRGTLPIEACFRMVRGPCWGSRSGRLGSSTLGRARLQSCRKNAHCIRALAPELLPPQAWFCYTKKFANVQYRRGLMKYLLLTLTVVGVIVSS